MQIMQTFVNLDATVANTAYAVVRGIVKRCCTASRNRHLHDRCSHAYDGHLTVVDR